MTVKGSKGGPDIIDCPDCGKPIEFNHLYDAWFHKDTGDEECGEYEDGPI